MNPALAPQLRRSDEVLACPCGSLWRPAIRCESCGTKFPLTSEIPVLVQDAAARTRQVTSCDTGIFDRRSLNDTFRRLPHPDTTWHWSRFLSHTPEGPTAILDCEQGAATLALCPPDEHAPLIGFTELGDALWAQARLGAYGRHHRAFVHAANHLPFLPQSLGLLIIRYPQRLLRDPLQLWRQVAVALRPRGYLYLEGVSAGMLPWLSLAPRRSDFLEGHPPP